MHKELGPGLLESAYSAALVYELLQAGLSVEVQKPLPFAYKGVYLDCGYRIDLLVEGKIVVEIKAVELLNDIPLAQVVTYLKLSDHRLGLLLNFNVLLMKNGIRRVASKF